MSLYPAYPVGGIITPPGGGAAYMMMSDGSKKYISPEAMHTGTVPHGGTFNQNTGEIETGTNWSLLLTLVVAGLFTAGIADAIISGAASAGIDTGAATEAVSSGAVASEVTPEAASALTTAGAPTSIVSAAAPEAAGATAPSIGGSAALAPEAGGSAATTIPGGAAASLPSEAPVLGGAGGAGALGKAANLLGAAGRGIGAAGTAAGNNALDQERLALQANGQNIAGQNSIESALMARAKEEDLQRRSALKDVYRDSWANNVPVSPYNPAGAPKFSADYLSTLGNLKTQGAAMLANPAQYGTGALPPPPVYKPIDITNVQGATNTKPGGLQQAANWLAPGMTLAGAFLNWGK